MSLGICIVGLTIDVDRGICYLTSIVLVIVEKLSIFSDNFPLGLLAILVEIKVEMVNVLSTSQIFPVFEIVPVAISIALEMTTRNDSSFNRFWYLTVYVSSWASYFWIWSSSSCFDASQIVSATCLLVFFKDWLLISCNSSSWISCMIGCDLISFCRSYSYFCDDKIWILADALSCVSWA